MLLTLESLSLDPPLNNSGEVLVLVELILPRPAIARRAALKPFTLSQGRRSLAREPFYEKALLKEKVDGPFGIKVSLTRPVKHPERHKFLRQLLATGIESSTDLLSLPALSLSRLWGDVLEEAGDTLADKIADTSPSFIVTGGLDLDSATLTSGEKPIPLKLTETIRMADLPPGPKSRDKRKQQAKTYRKGSMIGQVKLAVDGDR